MDTENTNGGGEIMLPAGMENNVYLNVKLFEQVQRASKVFAESTFVPDSFKRQLGNCVIALDMALKMNCHPLMLMQSMYIVHGRPGFEGKFIIALLNNSGRYNDPLEYEWKGERGKPSWGCRAFAVRKSTGKTVTGPWVDWEMVLAEQWNKDKPYRDGKGVQRSKWNTMPELMFIYRASSFFGKTNDPDLLMGMQTIDELEDAQTELVRQADGSYAAVQQSAEIGYKPAGKPGPDMYAVNAKPPNKAPEAAKEPDKTGQTEQQMDAAQGQMDFDDYGTAVDSPFEKSIWFHQRKGTPENGTGFAAWLKKNHDKMEGISSKTYNGMFEKYKTLYPDKTWPYNPSGYVLPDKESIEAYNWVKISGIDDITRADLAHPPEKVNSHIGDEPPQETEPPAEASDDVEKQEAETPLVETAAAQLLANMAKKHKREYLMIVRKQIPESVEQIYQWVELINELVVKHAQERQQGGPGGDDSKF